MVCFDEVPTQLIAETRRPVPAKSGQPERYDYEYQRNGTCNQFLFVEPAVGWRHVEVTDQRTQLDFANQMKWLSDERHPEVALIRVVLDNLNTHRPASLYEAFPPAEARRILKRLEFHHTPKHASWLNMAEIEINVMVGQCWDRRIGDKATLVRETQALEAERNAAKATIRWQFTADHARERLQRLYPCNSA